MRIVAAAVVPLGCPLRTPLVTARGTIAVRAGFVLRLTSDTGEVGEGEASPVHWLGERSLHETAADLERVVAAIPHAPELHALRTRFLVDAGADAITGAAACALDTALLDAEARSARVGVGELLGAAPATAVPVAALVAGSSEAALLADVDAALGAGFATIKMKVGGAPHAVDLRRVAAVRERIGPHVRLRLDANRAWSFDAAHRALVALAAAHPEYVEEPLADGDAATLVALTHATRVPLALDESIVDAADLERVIGTGARVHVVLKAGRVGGPTRLLALARHAHAAGLSVIVTDAIESAVGMRLVVHVAAALPGEVAAVGLGGAQLLADGEARALRRPTIVAAGPGLAVDLPAPVAAVAAHG